MDLLPEKFVAESLIDAFKEINVENQTMLWIKAAESRDVIYDGLMKLGAIVDECIAYRTVPETDDYTGAQAKFIEDGADMVTFTSSSTAEHFFALDLPWQEKCVAASIGPITTSKLKELDHKPAVEAGKHDIPGLVKAITDYFGK